MKQFKQDKENNKIKTQRIAQVVVLITAFVLVISQIVISNSFSTSGETVIKLERETKILEEENKQLRAQISQKGSLYYIEEQALVRGFVELRNIISLSSAIPVVFKP